MELYSQSSGRVDYGGLVLLSLELSLESLEFTIGTYEVGGIVAVDVLWVATLGPEPLQRCDEGFGGEVCDQLEVCSLGCHADEDADVALDRWLIPATFYVERATVVDSHVAENSLLVDTNGW